MADSLATYTRDIVVDLPDFPAGEVQFWLATTFAAAGSEGFPIKEYTLTLDENGQGTQALPVPDNTGDAAWLWKIVLPDKSRYRATLAYGSALALTAWLAAEQATETPNDLLGQFVLKDGDTMTGALRFSGGDHEGIVPISLTEAERDALVSPATGAVIWNTTAGQLETFNGSIWVAVASGAGGGAPTDVQYVTLAASGGLSAERVLTAGAGITITDGGAGNAVTIAAPAAAAADLGALADVEITTPADSEVLAYDSTSEDWINQTAAEAGLAVAGHDHDADYAAASHQHAAGDVTSGTLAHERGGLEADVSAYAGLVKISGGATSQAVAGTDYETAGAAAAVAGDLSSHEGDTNNPHGVTAAQAGALPEDAAINAQSSAYELVAGDAGKIVECDGTFTVTLPDGLDTGFQCSIVNVGSGVVTLAAEGILQSRDGAVTLASQYGAAVVYHRGAGVWLAIGDLS